MTLEYQNSDFLSKVDLRLKLLFSLLIVFLIYLSEDLQELLLLLSFVIITSIFLTDPGSLFKRIWGLKYFIMSFVIFYLLLYSNSGIIELVTILVKFLIIILAFTSLSKSTNPDQITSALIQMRIPITFSWAISLTIRQFYFINDEIASIWDLYKLRLRSQNGIGSKLRILSPFITSVFAMSIQRAINLRRSLQARGFVNVHREIVTFTQIERKQDGLFISFFLLPLLIFLIIRSQLFM